MEDPENQLIAVTPAGFVAERDAAAARAKAAGDHELAGRLKSMRKPTTAAWLVNALVREDAVLVEQFLELGQALAAAQSTLRGAELRALSAQRGQLVTALVARAEVLGRAAGLRVDSAAASEVQDTLLAALADPAAADGVRAGRLVRPLTYSGFGVAPAEDATPSPARNVGASTAKVDAKQAADAKAREREIAAARRACEAAEVALSQARAAAEAAQRSQADLDSDLMQARDLVRDLERRLAEAALTARAAQAGQVRAERHYEQAHLALERM